MSADATPLKFQEKLGYGLGDTASNFFFQVFNLFLLYYYTDMFGLAPAAVGTMFLVTKVVDAISDPVCYGRQFPTGSAVTQCLFRLTFRPPAS
jgi:GPH family glycoside/pentoside/hexuronide:cation symporter